ncbi:3,4-dihydroxy-2-butanone-4-phosphate synthase [Dermacoccaceae bacterium W4C1]
MSQNETPAAAPADLERIDARVEAALHAMRAGRPVLVMDDEDRENEGDLIMAATGADPDWVGFAVRHGSGLLCAPMDAATADRLDLPLMVSDNQDPRRTAYTVTVDAAEGVSTGISADDRAQTLRVLADPASGPQALIRPGHVLPLRARDGGVLTRRGHTEAAVDLCRAAGLPPVGMIVELVDDTGRMLRGPQVTEFGAAHDLVVLTIEDLVSWRMRHDRVSRQAQTRLPTEHGTFTVHAYLDEATGAEVLALTHDLERVRAGSEDVWVRVHSECLTGDALGSLRCDCGPQLQEALRIVGRDGGAVLLMRGQEGRGVGLIDKLRAYAEQDRGLDTVDAQRALGLPVDAREYGAAVAVLHDLELRRVALLSGNPDKRDALTAGGIEVAGMYPVITPVTPENDRYLTAKRERMGHLTENIHPADGPKPTQPSATRVAS